MRRACSFKPGVAAMAGGLLLLTGASPLIQASSDGHFALAILGQKVVGDVAEVTLFNAGRELLSGRVVLEIRSEGRVMTVEVPFTVWGGQKIFVTSGSTTRVDGIIRVGIIVDDGAPL